jgi:hypothetical protein
MRRSHSERFQPALMPPMKPLMRETTPFSIASTPSTRLLAAWNARSPMAAGSRPQIALIAS